jgi:hypothetical protein
VAVLVEVGVEVLVAVGVKVGHFFGLWLLGIHPAVGGGLLEASDAWESAIVFESEPA